MVLFLITDDFWGWFDEASKLMFCKEELLGLDADEIGLAEIRSEFIAVCLVGVLGRHR